MKCHFKNCKKKQSVIGRCTYCNYIFCLQHRYLEEHKCVYYEDFLNNAKLQLQKQLRSGLKKKNE